MGADVFDGGMVYEALGPVTGDADSYIGLVDFLFCIIKESYLD